MRTMFPAGMHYGSQAAESEVFLYAESIPSKWSEQIKMGLFTRTRWADIFLKATTKDIHAGMDKARRGWDTGEDMSMSSGVLRFLYVAQKCAFTYQWEEFEGVEEQMYDTAANLHAQLKAFDDIKKVVLKGY